MSAPSTPVARTPLHHWHTQRGARFFGQEGWQLPAAYTGADQEAAAAHTGLGLADISAFAKVSLLGREVSAFAQALLGPAEARRPGSVDTLSAGGPVLACRLAEHHL